MEAKRKKEYPKIMSQQNKRKQEKMENNTFTYQYSTTRNREVENIRRKYMPQEENKLKQLKKLDARVQNAGVVQGLCLGIIGAKILTIDRTRRVIRSVFNISGMTSLGLVLAIKIVGRYSCVNLLFLFSAGKRT